MLLALILLAFGCEKNVKEEETMGQPDSLTTEKIQPEKTKEEVQTVEVKKTNIAPVGEEILTESEMWAEYNAAKEAARKAREKSNQEDLKLALLRAASYAKKLNRPDIVAWQLNNIGYYSILEFKKRTDYDARMQAIETMKYDSTKINYMEQTRDVFLKQMDMLNVAAKHLNDALEFDSKLNDKNRTEKITSNLKFIEWVQQFTNLKFESQQGQ